MSFDEWVEVSEAAKLLGIGVRTLRRWVSDGYGPKPRRWGGRRVLQWRRVDLIAFRESDDPPPYPRR